MLIPFSEALKAELHARGVESFLGAGANISRDSILEPPCSIKWLSIENSFRLGAFSYAVSGYASCVSIGRYTSIGEAVQIGRASHPIDWVSTSPFFYLPTRLFDVGSRFDASEAYAGYGAQTRADVVPTSFKPIRIGNDVYVGHGAMIMPGVTVGDGAVVAANAVVTSDVPPYGIVAGNPARLVRFRLDPKVFVEFQELEWWRFAPWQLKSVDFSNPLRAIDELKAVVQNEPVYAPGHVSIFECC